MVITIADEDRKKCELYNEFYRMNKRNTEFVNVRGIPTERYWIWAREFVEPKLRAWKEERARRKV
jgi:hypothetical protein